jgi:hypothetical protein
MQNKNRWFFQSILGILFTGVGICMLIDAGFSRFEGNEWFWYGTGSLIIFQAGLCLVIDGVRFR